MQKTQKNQSDKELRILEAAGTLFARFGLKKTSMDEIAQQAGLGKGTIYLYFKNKEELFAAIVQGFGEKMLEGLAQATLTPVPADVQLRDFIHNRLNFVADRIAEMGACCEVMREFEDSQITPPMAPIIMGFRSRQIELLEHILERGINHGTFACQHPKVTAMAILCALEGYCREWPWEPWDQHTIDLKAEVISNLLLHGLCKSPPNDLKPELVSPIKGRNS